MDTPPHVTLNPAQSEHPRRPEFGLSGAPAHAAGESLREAKATVGVIGGGLAGLAAGCALSQAGYKVTVFERRPYLGGRASSYVHPGTGEVVDNCQHVLLGCCTNLLDLYRRLGVKDRIRWYDRLTYVEPGGRRGTLEPSGLPAPLHALPAFFRFPLLSLRDKLSITVGMLSLIEGVPADDGGSFLQWLKRHGQTQHAINRFWSPVLVSALNEELGDVSIHYGAMVFRDAFLKSAQAGCMGLPSVPLSQLYGEAANYIRERSGKVMLRTSVDGLGASDQRAWVTVRGSVATAFDDDSVPFAVNESMEPQEGGRREFDYLISAVPFQGLAKLMPPAMQSDVLRENLAQLRTSPITGIHFWFDRGVTELDHAVLLDRTIQWMFQKSKILKGQAPAADAQATGSYLELVVSSSKKLVEKSRQEVLDLALAELGEFFPAVKSARVVKATVIKEIHATFTPLPGVDRYRPPQQGPWPRIFLSGDWTATGWPATMEGAVRAGYAAAEALTAACGDRQHFLVPDLAAQGLMRLFGPR
jgi:squalene-associated FAD-dependent desaturase